MLSTSNVPGTAIGIDMGVANHITLSSGESISVLVQETPRLRRLQKKAARQYARFPKDSNGKALWVSNNYLKTRALINKEYEKMSRKKDNLANQITHRILDNEHVFYQDEMLTNWKVRFGRQLHHSVLGRIKRRLAQSPRAHMLDKSVATTQFCRQCGMKTKHSLDKRVFCCAHCGFTDDRDIHAANNMIFIGSQTLNVPVDCGEITLVPVTEDGYLSLLGCTIQCIERNTTSLYGGSSLKQEVHPLLAGGQGHANNANARERK